MNKSKTVAGMTRNQCASDAAERALESGADPEYVDRWLAWFDKAECSKLPLKSDKDCAQCIDKKQCEASQCHSEP